jgi:tetratricopeptide (TPR) repeat protein
MIRSLHPRAALALIVAVASIVSAVAQTRPPAQPVPPRPPAQGPSGPTLRYPSQEFWSNPENIARFTATYGVLSPVEPRITAEEQTLFRSVIEQMRTDRNAALQVLQAAVKPDSSAAIDFAIGNIHFESGRLDQAMVAYRNAIQKWPDFLRSHRNLGILLVQGGNFKEALQHLARAANLGASDSITYGLVGLCHLNLSQNLSAEASYRQAIILDPDTIDWKLGLVRAILDQGKNAEGIALLEEILKVRPDDANLWLAQANAFIGANELNRATANYEIVRRMGAANAESLMQLGDLYMNDNMRELALEVYMQGLERDANQTPNRTLRALEILVSRGALSEAETLIARARQTFSNRLSPDQSLSIMRLNARILLAQGRGTEAVRDLEQIVERDPLDGDALILLAQHYARQRDDDGAFERAVFYFERASRVEGKEAEALTTHAQALVARGEFSRAVPLIERAQQVRPRENVGRYLEQVRQAAAAQAATRM